MTISISIVAFTIPILLLPHLAHGIIHAGQYNGFFDVHIACDEHPVPDNTNGLPPNYSPAVYHDSIELCSALNSQTSRTVGCVCSSDQMESLHCHPEIAAPELYNAVYTIDEPRFHGLSFPSYCKEQCICRPAVEQGWGAHYGYEEEGEAESEGEGEGEGGSGGADQGSWGGTNSTPSTWNPKGVPGRGTQPNYPPISHTDALNQEPVSHDQCRNNCTGNTDCKAGCMCSVQSEQYQPGRGTVAFLAACIISMAVGKNNPRGEGGGRPCPCNSTYVSFACCGVADGIVWERAEFKLGELY